MKKIVSIILTAAMVLCMSVPMTFAAESATGASASAQQTTTFSDLSGKDCENAVNALVKAGIINGFSDGTFKPEQPVTREQLAAIISRYAVSKGIVVYDAANVLASTDVVSAWARRNVAWAAPEGILTKTETTNATKTASRAEVATAIYTYLTKTAK